MHVEPLLDSVTCEVEREKCNILFFLSLTIELTL